ncbi:MAG: heavy metal translocating P-type ATPase, partial [Mucispirillum sp.]|nr:heavy metal translocating P-type ATPase [Mucispirillum sp.]
MKSTQNNTLCAHCRSQINIKTCIYEEESNNYFCCEGCRSVYHLINEEGFSSFYDKRTGWESGPVEQVVADDEYFAPYLQTMDNGDCVLSVVISGIRCAACVWLLESSSLKDPRIKSFRINYANHKAKIVFNPKEISLQETLEKITRLGYCPLPIDNSESVYDKERKNYFFRFGVSVFFTMQVMIYSVANYAGYFQGMDTELYLLFQLISWALATPVILYSAFPFFKNTYINLKHFHFTMDTLVAMGAGSAYLYSIAAIFLGYETYFDTAVTIITLILLGRFIESGAKQRGGNTVSKLLSLKPKNVKKIVSGENNERTHVIIPIEQLKKGDYFEIVSGGSVAADGKITEGVCEIDESMLTGEPIPVNKKAGDEVFAGTKVIGGECIVIAERVGQESLLSKIAASVDDAQSSKAPIQDIADSLVSKFVPFVLIIAALTFCYWFFAATSGVENSLMRAVSVLVIACPCAMGLATPLAIINSATKLAEAGVIFKNGEAIERFARVNDFYFDKTGTITMGKMAVTEYKADKDIINAVSSAAFYSKHPASKAISFLNDTLLPNDYFEEIAGKGVKADIEGNHILIGSLQFMKDCDVSNIQEYQQVIDNFLSIGLTVVCASFNNELKGVFGISDTIRDEAKDAIRELSDRGNRVTVITGDNAKAAEIILKKSGIDAEIKANVSPFGKAEIIKNAQDINKTAMVGDGINDAIALTAASVGISMRNSTDISIESASAVLLRNDLTVIWKSHKICKKTLRIILENLFWSFSYNII